MKIKKLRRAVSNQPKPRKHIKYIKAYPDSLESAHRLVVLSTTFGKEKTSEWHNKLNPGVKNSDDGKMIKQYLLLNKELEIGDKFVDFEMSDSSGPTTNTDGIFNKLVIVFAYAACITSSQSSCTWTRVIVIQDLEP